MKRSLDQRFGHEEMRCKGVRQDFLLGFGSTLGGRLKILVDLITMTKVMVPQFMRAGKCLPSSRTK